MIVHILAEPVESRLPGRPGRFVTARQPVENQAEMQHQQIEPAIQRVRDAEIAVEDRRAGLRHDGAIERLDGRALGVPAKHRQHWSCSRAGPGVSPVPRRCNRWLWGLIEPT